VDDSRIPRLLDLGLSLHGAEGDEMTFATHPERQFMQHLRGAGWIKAGLLPPSARLVKNLLNKGWIEQQSQGPKNETYFRLTEKGLEAKRAPVPTGKSPIGG
jgi:hypothetical protein